jgi:hypothetical protein
MSNTLTIALTLIGLAPVIVAVVGISLPPGERLASLLALVAGAGVGVVTLVIGTRIVTETGPPQERVFLVGSILGFLATIGTLALLHRATRRPPTPS